MRKKPSKNKGKRTTFRQLIKNRRFVVFILSPATMLVNFYFFFSFAFNTVINSFILYGLFIGSCIAGNLAITYTFKIKKEYWRVYVILALSPLIINLFFVVNFAFARNPVNERYTYRLGNHLAVAKDKYESSSYQTIRPDVVITLSRSAYSHSVGVRFFPFSGKIYHGEIIDYTFKDGLFGLRVMTDYRIE